MEINTELILLSGDISNQVILQQNNTSYSDINYYYNNNIDLFWDSYFSLDDNSFRTYIDRIGVYDTYLNISGSIITSIWLSIHNYLLINKIEIKSYIDIRDKIYSLLRVLNISVLSRFYLLSNINNLIIFKSSFLRGCMIPRLDIRNSVLIKYSGVIPRLAYKLISIGKRFFFFNNKFLSMKK